ncbi:putative BTB/POZ domain-containing protein 6 [Hypsibius exemplaris]|uniref:BTB/POZ domain-containing protein 6 n=1 Tax=Hypsibius exemplaris TaxID=2072580 RepID=A0A9X6NCM7_HYPEX|nr:putative BTB/POZ domain-containing protein 6 [Hypsibius exemplaris]
MGVPITGSLHHFASVRIKSQHFHRCSKQEMAAADVMPSLDEEMPIAESVTETNGHPKRAPPAKVEESEQAQAARESKPWQEMKHLRKKIAFLLDHEDIMPTDITFRVGLDGAFEDITAHTFVLALGSTEFYRLFVKKQDLSGTAIERYEIFWITDVQPEVFRILIQFLYSEEVSGLNMENVMEAIYCAKKYAVARLLKLCRAYVQDHLTAEFACQILAKANTFEEDTIAQLASAIIGSQTACVVASEGFLHIPEHGLRLILSRDDLSIGENDVYQATRKWIVRNYPNHPDFEEAAARLVDCIRLPIMTPSQIANGPAKDKVLAPIELSEVYNYIFADEKPVIRFSARSRLPRPKRQYVTMKLTEEDPEKVVVAEDTITIEVRCDVAPLASGTFLTMCHSGERHFTISYGDAEFSRRTAVKQSSLTKSKQRRGPANAATDQNGHFNGHGRSFPVENRLLSNIPGWVSFASEDPEEGNEVRAETLQICHAEKKANRLGLGGMVFAKVVRGMEALKVFSAGSEDWRSTRRVHSFSNVVVHADFLTDDSEEEL